MKTTRSQMFTTRSEARSSYGHPDQIAGSIDQCGIGNDIAGQIPEDLDIKGIHLIIFPRNHSGSSTSRFKEGLERLCSMLLALSAMREYRSVV